MAREGWGGLGIALAIILCAGTATAQAPHTPKCSPMIDLVDGAAKAGLQLEQISPAALAILADRYNRTPPVSDIKFTVGFVADLPGGGGIIALGMGSEICAEALIPADHWKRFRREVLGTGA
jgi:hypothetical protein